MRITFMSLFKPFLWIMLPVMTAMGMQQEHPNYYFKQLSLQDGLTQSTVRCILNDREGFIWIGTKNGLNRFDRHELKNYQHEPDNPNSLPDNLIHFITEDHTSIWVATENGLARYQRKEDNFIPVRFKGSRIKVRSCLHLKDGILFGGNGRLFEYSYALQEIREIPCRNSGTKNFTFTFLIPWEENRILVGSRWNGLWIYDFTTCRLTPAPFCTEKKIISLFVDSDRNLWISPYAKGLLCFSPKGELLSVYTTENSDLNHNVILDIEEKNGQLWLATDGGGINILDVKKKSFTVIEHIPGNLYSLPVNSIYCLYRDKENNLWAGTVRGGLLAIKNVYIRIYRDAPHNNPFGLSEKTVLCLYEDEDGIIWTGTDGGGINRLDPGKNVFTHYPDTYRDKVASITGYNKEKLLISIFGKGLYLFNKKTGKTEPFIFINEEENKEIARQAITTVVNRHPDGLIQLFGNKVYIYDPARKKFEEVVSPDNPGLSMRSLQLIGSDDRTTYLYSEKHIFRLDNKTKTIHIIYTLPQSYPTIITCVSRDAGDNFWIGTNKGLIRYNRTENTTETIKNNLLGNVTSLIFDKKNKLWIGSQGTLFCYLVKENKFTILGESDGAPTNEYLARPTLLSASGDIYMGGVMGLVRIDKNIRFEETTQPVVELTEVLLNGVPVKLENKSDLSLSVPWDHTSIGIKVMVKEKDVFRKKIFRYHIEGLNNQLFESYDHVLTLYTLPAGNYDIMVSCNTKDGGWNTPTKILSLSIAPPWWKSNWFIMSVIVLLLGSSALLSLYIIRKKEMKHKWEIKEHEQKTYEEKIRFLINISHELRTPLTLIYAPLKRLLNGHIDDNDLRRQLTGIYKQSRQMKNMIDMVLNVRKMEVGQDSLLLLPHPLNEWLRSVADDFKNEMLAKNIHLIYDLDENIGNVSFDEKKCEIVISNLLMNAIKFSEPDTEIILSTRKTNSMARISVKDRGIGLGGADISKLFNRFYQGNHDRKGSGIGLSYAKMLIEMHGGRIDAVNNEDKGATFYYELPLTDTAEEVSCQAKPYLNELLYSPEQYNPETQEFPTRGYSLLIVEDEPELRKFLKDTLNDYFKHIYLADNGRTALAAIRQNPPDIIISDVMMPDMNGFELCKHLKENIEISHIPIILLTARSDSESISFGYKSGADAYLAKPFDTDFLMILIRNQLRNREYIKSRYKNFGPVVTPEETAFSNADEKFLLKLNKLVTDNLSNQNLDVKYIVDRIGMSRASLYNKMKALTNLSVNDYINKFRIEEAIRLLTVTDLSIVEISEKTGFSNQRYFSTVFKQMTGNTPSGYREKNKTKTSPAVNGK